MSRYYCVIRVADRQVVYAGTSEASTAGALEPGTVYGMGRTKHAAWWDAIKRRDAVPKTQEEPT